MPKLVPCPSCRKALRVGEEFEGQQMRCPSCQLNSRVPSEPVWQTNASSPSVNEFGEIIRGSRPNPAVPQPRTPYPQAASAVEPHRGTAVLLLGVISLLCLTGCMFHAVPCIVGTILGLIGWLMGHGDLAKIRAGQMDLGGYGPTQAGWICSIFGTLLNALMVLLCGGFILLVWMFDLIRA